MAQLTIGMLVAFQSLMLSFMRPVTQLINLGNRLQEAEGDLNRLDDVLRYPVDPRPPTSGRPRSIGERARLEGYLELRDVTFGYSRLAEPLIADFNLTIKPGQRWPWSARRAAANRRWPNWWRVCTSPGKARFCLTASRAKLSRANVMNASVAMVDQNIALFSGTIRDNLTLWNPTIPKALDHPGRQRRLYPRCDHRAAEQLRFPVRRGRA